MSGFTPLKPYYLPLHTMEPTTLEKIYKAPKTTQALHDCINDLTGLYSGDWQPSELEFKQAIADYKNILLKSLL